MPEFESFWNYYPRKVAKKHAMQMWQKLTADQQQKAIEKILTHANYWISTGRDSDKIPHAGSWLNGWRFDDEIEPVKSNVQQIAWWSSESGCVAKGRELGLDPRPGEGMAQFKGRINETITRRQSVAVAATGTMQ